MGDISGSGRADGAICEFSADEGMGYYQSLKKNNVVNVEMESLAFAALTCRAGFKSAVLAVILSDRLETDQVNQNFIHLSNIHVFSEKLESGKVEY